MVHLGIREEAGQEYHRTERLPRAAAVEAREAARLLEKGFPSFILAPAHQRNSLLSDLRATVLELLQPRPLGRFAHSLRVILHDKSLDCVTAVVMNPAEASNRDGSHEELPEYEQGDRTDVSYLGTCQSEFCSSTTDASGRNLTINVGSTSPDAFLT